MSSIEELFDNNQKMGSLITLVALLSMILAIIGIVVAALYDVSIVVIIIAAIGTLIYAYLLYQFGLELRDNSVDKVPLPFVTNIIGPFIEHSRSLSRVSIFAGIVRFIGMGLIISSIFWVLAYIIGGWGLLIGGPILLILIGLVFLWASKEISKGGNHSFMWILLIILFILALIGSLFSLISGLSMLIVSVAQSLITLLLSGFALYLGMTPEVKTQMGA